MKQIIKLVIAFIIMIQSNALKAQINHEQDQYFLYVGAYTQAEDEGIYLYKFNANDGSLHFLNTTEDVKNPSYLAIDPKRNLLIAVNETEEFEGKKSGAVTSFSINSSNGSLQKLSQVASGGSSPCYVSINKNGSHAFVANYSGGNVAVFPILSNGIMQPYSDLKQHQGSGPVDGRQNGPHAHSIVLSPDAHFALAADLGIDQVISYGINEKEGLLELKNEFDLTQGSGPRHLVFHQNKKLAFIISELNSTISSCTYDAKTGKLTQVMTVSTLPEGFEGTNSCADIHVSPDGRFLYGSNRGHDSIVIFAIDQKTGKLEYVDHRSVNGKTPRNFMIDPTGKFLLAANQDSNNIVVFKIDKETGKLKTNGVEVKVSKPVCLKMMSIK